MIGWRGADETGGCCLPRDGGGMVEEGTVFAVGLFNW